MSFNYNTAERSTLSLMNGEQILWEGKPKKSAFIATKSLTLMPIAIIWLFFDLGFIIPFSASGSMSFFIIPFFALHLMPVWIWLGNVFTARRRYNNTNYYVTNRRIITQYGSFAVNETTIYYKDIRNARINIGLIDKAFGVGDIVFDCGISFDNRRGSSQNLHGYIFEELEDPQQAYSQIQKIILDIQADMEYPNALRPDTNPGYNTKYTP